MKSGANFEDRNAIKRWHEAGASVEEISTKVQIQPQVVARFVKALEAPEPEGEELEGEEPEGEEPEGEELEGEELEEPEDPEE